MKKVNKRGIAAILATMVMMTGCGTSNGGSAAEVKPEGQNLTANAKVDKANVDDRTKGNNAGSLNAYKNISAKIDETLNIGFELGPDQGRGQS